MTTETKTTAQFEIPKGIVNFANLRTRTDVYVDIFDRYCPKISLESLPESRRFALGYEDVPLSGGPIHKACSEAKETHGIAVEEAVKAHRLATETAGDDGVDAFKPGDVSPIVDFCPHRELTEVHDPDVLWVGRVLDGLTAFGVFSSRRLAKSLINTIPLGRPFRANGIAGQFTGGGIVQMWFKPAEPRKQMIESAQGGGFNTDPAIRDMILRGEAPTIAMGTIIKDAEPGEIRNSPTVYDKETPPGEDVDMWAAGKTESSWEPTLRLDNLYGMHYLKRGDEITIAAEGWPRPSTPAFEHKWILKPISEGPSLVQQDAGGNNVVQLSSMRA